MKKPESLKGLAEEVKARLERGELPLYTGNVSDSSPCDPDCSICKGRGMFTYDVDSYHPEFGKAHRCPNLPTDARTSGISRDEIDAMEWSDIIDEGDAMDAVTAVVSAIEVGYGWVYLFGKPGRAKTLILKRAVKEAIGRQMIARYAQTSQVLDWLRESFDQDKKQFTLTSRMEELYRIKVLCLDEFDRFNGTDWAQQQVQMLMNQRYEGAIYERSVTVMASNAPPSIYDPYLRDRIQDSRFVVMHMKGDSLRPAADKLGV